MRGRKKGVEGEGVEDEGEGEEEEEGGEEEEEEGVEGGGVNRGLEPSHQRQKPFIFMCFLLSNGLT